MNANPEKNRLSSASSDPSEVVSEAANSRATRFRFLRAFGETFGILICISFFHL